MPSRIRPRVGKFAPLRKRQDEFWDFIEASVERLNVEEAEFCTGDYRFRIFNSQLQFGYFPYEGPYEHSRDEVVASLVMTDAGQYAVGPKPVKAAATLEEAEDLFLDRVAMYVGE